MARMIGSRYRFIAFTFCIGFEEFSNGIARFLATKLTERERDRIERHRSLVSLQIKSNILKLFS